MPTVKDLQPSFWRGFNAHVKKSGIALFPSESEPEVQWHRINLRVSDVHIEVIANQKGNRVELYFTAPKDENEALFTRLETLCKERSITKFGSSIKWELLPDNDLSKVVLYRDAGNIKKTETWPEQYEWLSTKAFEMQEFFIDDLRALTGNA